MAEGSVGTSGHEGAIPPRPAGGDAPMSNAQELIWLLDRATPGLTAYNMTIARRLTGPLDVVALQRALDAVVARHEALRTRFAADDSRHEPVQLIDSTSSTQSNADTSTSTLADIH